MPSLNKVILIGHMTRDVQLKNLPSGSAVADFGLAMNRKWTDQSGAKKEKVCFVDCTAFGKQAETINQYVKKGDAFLVEGRLDLDQWKDKDGGNRSKLKVVVEGFQFLGGGKGGAKPAADTAPVPAFDPAVDDGVPF